MIRFARHRSPMLLLLLAGLLAGCVWLRLLEIKNQLAEFDRYIKTEVVDGHFVVRFHEPVLLSRDVVELSKLRPSRVTTENGRQTWFLDFRMDPPHTRQQAKMLIAFAMSFTPEHKLSAFTFPPLFLEMAPPVFLEASIRSLGLGKVDQEKRQLKVSPEDLPKLTGPLPTRAGITAVLGPPDEDYRYEGQRIIRYRFLAAAEPVSAKHESRREAEAKLFFDAETDSLARLSGRFAGLRLSIDYRKLVATEPQPDDAGPRPAP